MAFNRYSLDLEASSSQFAYVADNSALSITGDLTLEAWVKFESITALTEYSIISKDNPAPNRCYALFFQSSAASNILRFIVSSDGTNANTTAVTVSFTPSTGKWYHLAVSYDASAGSASFYVNGIQQGTTQTGLKTSIVNTSGDLKIGATWTGAASFFDGLISNVRIWSDVRTQQEIQDNMYSILTGTSNNLVGSWFNDANDYNDDAGTNNLTASGSPVFSTNVPWTGANTTDWSAPYEIQSDNTKVSGSSNHTDIPLLIADGNLSSSVYAGVGFSKYSLSLDSASSQYAYVADNVALSITGDISGSAWIKPTTITDSVIFSKYQTSPSAKRSYEFDMVSGKIRALFSDDGTFNAGHAVGFTGTTTLQAGKWYHVAFSFDISTETCKIYVNGQDDGATLSAGSSIGASLYDGDTQFRIGANGNTSGSVSPFNGQISNVCIWSDVRTQQEIQDNMHVVLTGTSNNLIGSWYNNDNDHNDNGGTNNLTASGGATIISNDIPINDLRITTDQAGTTEIPFEIVSLDKVNEKAEIWAKVPTLSYNSNTSLFIWYGNASAVAYDASAPFGAYSVWTNYDRVHHFDTLVTDYSGNGKTLTNNGTVAQDTSSKINDGTDYGTSNSSKYFTYTTMPATGSSSVTVQFWVNSAQTTTGDCYHVGWDDGSAHALIFQLNGVEANKLRAYWSGGLYSLYATTTMNDEAWHQVTYTYAGGTNGAMALYIDGNLEDSTTGTGALSDSGSGQGEFIGRRSRSAINYLSAKTDELRTIYNGTNPSADWIATEYNNQNAPSTFWVAIGSSSPSASQSPSSSVSASVSPSSSSSASQSPSSSVSSSQSPSASQSPSSSSSSSQSPSSSVSPSVSPSSSQSASISPSSSISPSISPSSSDSASPSPTPSPGVSCVIGQNQQSGNGWTSVAGTHVTPDRKSISQTFVPSESANVCNIKVILQKTGNPSGNINCEIWSDSGGNPDTLLGTSDYPVAASSLSTSSSVVHFLFDSGPRLTSGQTYHIVLTPSVSYTNFDSSNNVKWFTQNSNDTDSYTSGKARYKNSSDTWADFSVYTYSDFYFAHYYDENTLYIEGSTVWGHDTSVLENNVRDFNGNWSGTGSITSSGDDEQICLASGQYMESEVVLTGEKFITLLQNEYSAGDTVALFYRSADTPSNIASASWLSYTGSFLSSGYVQVKIESTL